MHYKRHNQIWQPYTVTYCVLKAIFRVQNLLAFLLLNYVSKCNNVLLLHGFLLFPYSYRIVSARFQGTDLCQRREQSAQHCSTGFARKVRATRNQQPGGVSRVTEAEFLEGVAVYPKDRFLLELSWIGDRESTVPAVDINGSRQAFCCGLSILQSASLNISQIGRLRLKKNLDEIWRQVCDARDDFSKTSTEAEVWKTLMCLHVPSSCVPAELLYPESQNVVRKPNTIC